MLQARKLWDDLQEYVWLRPTLWTVGLGLLALIITSLDRAYFSIDSSTLPWFLINQAESARVMLGSISSAMLTVATLVFSITMVAVVQAANAYSPRVLREYLSDTSNHHVLGILMGTFLYCLVVLRGIEVRTGEIEPFVPVYAANIALLLSLCSIGAFIYFLDHVSHSIKVNHVIKLILSEVLDLTKNPFPSGVGKPWRGIAATLEHDDSKAVQIVSQESGYLQMIDIHELMEIAQEEDLTVRLEHEVGAYILSDTLLLTLWTAHAAPHEELLQRIRRTLYMGSEQTMVQDLLFGLRQLSDIALRALSPAVNDPSTALNCIDALAKVVIELLKAEPPSAYRSDEHGTLRIIAPTVSFSDAFEMAFGQIRRYGAGDVTIVLRLLALCREFGARTGRQEVQETLRGFLQALVESAADKIKGASDKRRITEAVMKMDGELQPRVPFL